MAVHGGFMFHKCILFQAESADMIKKMLRISGDEGQEDSTDTVEDGRKLKASYGRQVSLQELFDGNF